MKTKILMISMVSSFLFIGCNKEEDTQTPINAIDIVENAKIDVISDDVLQIVESQSNEFPEAGRGNTSQSFLGNCATVTTEQSGNTWVRTVDFGEMNCTLLNGNNVRGKIMITFNNDFSSSSRTILYTFENFYHNDRKIEGNRTVVKTILPNGHPKANISLNLKVTNTNGMVYLRSGNRVREFTSGYDTFGDFVDNEFSIIGSWTTTMPSGIVHFATITSPLIAKGNCPNIVQGTIAISRNNNSAVLDYGDGTCDALATLTINGFVRNITLGN